MDCLNLAYDIEDEVRLQKRRARMAGPQHEVSPTLGPVRASSATKKPEAVAQSQYGNGRQ